MSVMVASLTSDQCLRGTRRPSTRGMCCNFQPQVLMVDNIKSIMGLSAAVPTPQFLDVDATRIQRKTRILAEGDVLIFICVGDSAIKVSIFDLDRCEKTARAHRVNCLTEL